MLQLFFRLRPSNEGGSRESGNGETLDRYQWAQNDRQLYGLKDSSSYVLLTMLLCSISTYYP